MFQMLNIEIIDIYSQISKTGKALNKIVVDIEKIVWNDMITMFIRYYNSKLTFIMDKVKRKFEKNPALFI